MNTQTNYFRAVVRRENHIKTFIFDTALNIASFPRCFIETVIRRRMGRRYFSLATNITVAFVLAVLPIVVHKLPFLSDFSAQYNSLDEFNEAHSLGLMFWLHYGTWYIALFAFLYFTKQRWQEVRTKPGVMDCSRFTLCTGEINYFFFRLHPAGLMPSVRSVETIYEPVVFFLGGVVLSFLGQRVGNLLIVSSVAYSLSYLGAYYRGDNYYMDEADKRLLARDYEEAFIHGNRAIASGAQFYITRPNDADLARELKGSIVGNRFDDEDATFAE